MRVLVQRVSEASVKIDGKVRGAINRGLLLLIGIENDDTEDEGRSSGNFGSETDTADEGRCSSTSQATFPSKNMGKRNE